MLFRIKAEVNWNYNELVKRVSYCRTWKYGENRGNCFKAPFIYKTGDPLDKGELVLPDIIQICIMRK